MNKIIKMLLSLFKKKAVKKAEEVKKVITVHAPVVVAEPAAKPKKKYYKPKPKKDK